MLSSASSGGQTAMKSRWPTARQPTCRAYPPNAKELARAHGVTSSTGQTFVVTLPRRRSAGGVQAEAHLQP
jgi:hypothetical protein